MAIGLTYKQNTDPASPTYENGKIRDDSGNNDGTPVNDQVYGDFHQFFATLLRRANITANDLPENTVNGYQYNDALQLLIGPKNFNEELTEIQLAEGPYTVGRTVFVLNSLIYVVDDDANLVRVYDMTGTQQFTTEDVITKNAKALFVDKNDSNKIYVASQDGGAIRYDVDVFDSSGNHIPGESFTSNASSLDIVRDIYVSSDRVYVCGGIGTDSRFCFSDKGTGLNQQNRSFPIGGAFPFRDILPSYSGNIISFYRALDGNVTRYDVENDVTGSITIATFSNVHYDSGKFYAFDDIPQTLRVYNPNTGDRIYYEEQSKLNKNTIISIFIREDILYMLDFASLKVYRYRRNGLSKNI